MTYISINLLYLFMIGIYKIISPTGKLYIGQSKNIENRFKNYRKLRCKTQPKLYNSFLKHGVDNHIFSILEVCDILNLNERECYFIKLHNSTDRLTGMNCLSSHEPYYFCEETRLKMSKSASGKQGPMLGKKHSIESREKMSASKKGKPGVRRGAILSDSQKQLLRGYQLGKKQSEETRLKRINTLKGIGHPTRSGVAINTKKVLDTATGTIFNSLKESAIFLGIKTSTLGSYLRGQNKNKTTFTYLKTN